MPATINWRRPASTTDGITYWLEPAVIKLRQFGTVEVGSVRG
jgi:hypothetical protein